jgi:hypothetical protein
MCHIRKEISCILICYLTETFIIQASRITTHTCTNETKNYLNHSSCSQILCN